MSGSIDLYDPNALVRFGTSSFSWKDWVGPFYPQSMAPGAFLNYYATQFDTVEVDATYYAIPNARLVDGWASKVPDGFLLSCKFPKSIIHAGETYKPDPTKIMQPDATYEDRDEFLEVMSRMGPKLSTLLIQFPYFNRATFPSDGPFLERLDPFLRDLPKERFKYVVEIRNKQWLKPDLTDVLGRHGVGLALVDQAWMPHGDHVVEKLDWNTGDHAYIRLLGDRKEIEKLTKTWEKEVLFHDKRMERWAKLIAQMMEQGIRTLVYVNNHYAGHAPSTVRRLRDLFRDEID